MTTIKEFTQSLTKRELEIARLVAEGFENAEIAQRAGIAQGTLTNHLTAIYQKMDLEPGYNPRTTLARYYLLYELVGRITAAADGNGNLKKQKGNRNGTDESSASG